ncbi:MAG TPA: hypothetical protein VKG22_03250 [Stellaceae bacterium]|nr:hypothetical protein [Stellaceae bacterium]
MTDNGQVAIIGSLRHDLLDGANNSRLGIYCRLPASDAGFRLSKKRVDRRFELLLRQVTRRRAVILAEAIDHPVSAEPEPVSEDLRSISRFALAAGEDAAHPPCPRIGCRCAQACSAALIERPIGNRDARINCDIRVGDEEHRRH